MRSVLLGACTGMLLATVASAAIADDGVGVAPEEGGFTAGVTKHFSGSGAAGGGDRSQGGRVPVVEIGTVLFDGFCVGTNWTDACDPPEAVVSVAPTLTPGRVAQAFQSLPLPEARLAVQPPNGRTLVNFDTNFYTEQGELSRTVTLLGRQVELRIWPASFTWRFGDGASRRTTSPGSAYPHLEITHQYQRKGRVAPSVDTTYAAQFRVDGGAWRDVNGTVTIPGSPQSLQVVTARPVLVGG